MSTYVHEYSERLRSSGTQPTDPGIPLNGADPTAVAGASEGGGLDVSVLLHSLRRNWLLGSLLGLLLATPLAMLTYSAHKLQFKSSALVRISPNQHKLIGDTADTQGMLSRADFKSYKNTQKQLLLSPGLLNNALKKEGVQDLPVIQAAVDPVMWIQKELEITFPDDAEIMQISLALGDPKAAQKVVDAIVSTYYDEVVVHEQNQRLSRVDSLERVQTEQENKARAKRAELRNLVEQLGTGDQSTLMLAQQAAMQQMGLIRSQLTTVQLELMRAEGELEYQVKTGQVIQQPAPADGAVVTPDKSPAAGSEAPAEVASEKEAKPVKVIAANLASKPEAPVEGQPEAPAAPKADDAANPNPMAPVVLSSVDTFNLEKIVAGDAVCTMANLKIDSLTNQIEQTEKRLGVEAGADLMKRFQNQLAETKKKLSDRKQQLQDLYLLTSQGGPASPTTPLKDLPREIQILKSQQRRLQVELGIQQAEAGKIGRSSIDVDMMRGEVEGFDKVVARVTDELERTRIELKSNSRITLLGPAEVPQIGESKRRLPMTGAAALLGFLAPLMTMMVFDLRRHYVNGSKTMSGMMKMPVLGTLPMVPRNIMKRIGNADDSGASIWRRRLAESVAAVTSLLLHRLQSDGHSVVMITSATPGEGKSTLAEQLATSLAESGHRTLLIDFDLRRPVLHKRFGIRHEPGVSEVLRQGADLEDAVYRAENPNLSILVAGTSPGSLLQDAASGALKSLFEQARSHYEVVIVDSPPLLPVMDGRLIGRFTDGAILSVIKDVSQVPNLTTVLSIMADYSIPVLGCVVTGDSGDTNYGYGTYMALEHDKPHQDKIRAVPNA
jgi:succinoglycan biosynthesis transport protein ExoP